MKKENNNLQELVLALINNGAAMMNGVANLKKAFSVGVISTLIININTIDPFIVFMLIAYLILGQVTDLIATIKS